MQLVIWDGEFDSAHVPLNSSVSTRCTITLHLGGLKVLAYDESLWLKGAGTVPPDVVMWSFGGMTRSKLGVTLFARYIYSYIETKALVIYLYQCKSNQI